jgi:hypothetical protein
MSAGLSHPQRTARVRAVRVRRRTPAVDLGRSDYLEASSRGGGTE